MCPRNLNLGAASTYITVEAGARLAPPNATSCRPHPPHIPLYHRAVDASGSDGVRWRQMALEVEKSTKNGASAPLFPHVISKAFPKHFPSNPPDQTALPRQYSSSGPKIALRARVNASHANARVSASHYGTWTRTATRALKPLFLRAALNAAPPPSCNQARRCARARSARCATWSPELCNRARGKNGFSPRSLACSCRSDAFPRDRAHRPAPWSLGLAPDATASASSAVSTWTRVRGGLDRQGARGQPSRTGMAIVLGTALDRPALRRRWSPALHPEDCCLLIGSES